MSQWIHHLGDTALGLCIKFTCISTRKMTDQEEEKQMVESSSPSCPRHSIPPNNLSTKPKFWITVPPMVAESTLLSSPSLTIFGLILVATLIAGVHHFLLAFLQGRTVQDQFWVKNTSNTFSILVQTLCAASVSISLTQLIWWFLRRRPFTIAQLNDIFSLPNPFPTVRLASSKMLWRIFPIVTMAALVQAYTLVSILAPNALEVGTASPKTDTITVPTIFFGRDPQEHGWAFPAPPTYCMYQIANTFSRVLGSSLQSDTLVGRRAPIGCENGCNYTIEYGAPALLCSDIDAESIFDYANGTGSPFSPSAPSRPFAVLLNDSDSTAVYNGTYRYNNDGGNVTVAWRRYDINGDPIAGGVSCILFNTTQRSTVSFFNNTGVISASIVSYNVPYRVLIAQNTSSDCDGRHVPETSSTQSYYLSYSALMEWLTIRLSGTISYYGAQEWDVMSSVMETSLFVMNETAVTFSPRGASVKTSLEQVFVNLTVALIGAGREMTTVNATVVQNQLVWVYSARRLWGTYATALASTLICGGVGLACMANKEEIRDLAFSDIVGATRNVDLDSVFGAGIGDDAKNKAVLQYRVQRGDGKVTGGFGLVKAYKLKRAGALRVQNRVNLPQSELGINIQ